MKNIASPTNYTLLIWHILAHCAVIFYIFVGSLNELLIALLLYIIQSTIGGTITYHRLLSHKSFKCNNWFIYLGTCIGSLGGNGSGIAWAAVHREHHRFTDTEKDPHCPYHRGFIWTQFFSYMHAPNIKYVPDLLRNKFQVFIHNQYWLINLIYVILISLIDKNAIFYAYFAPALLTWHMGSFINTINHSIGYRSVETKDLSTNNVITGIIVSGEGWHNNHHADPNNIKFGKKWYEFDLGYQIIKLVKK